MKQTDPKKLEPKIRVKVSLTAEQYALLKAKSEEIGKSLSSILKETFFQDFSLGVLMDIKGSFCSRKVTHKSSRKITHLVVKVN